MKIKEYLRKAYRLDEKIDSDIRELEQTKSILYSVTTSYGGDRVQTSLTGDKIPNAVGRLMELEESINSEIDMFVDLKLEIRELIEQLTNADENLILRMRYIEFMQWGEIQKRLGFEDSEKMFKIHGRALKKLEEIKYGSKRQ